MTEVTEKKQLTTILVSQYRVYIGGTKLNSPLASHYDMVSYRPHLFIQNQQSVVCFPTRKRPCLSRDNERLVSEIFTIIFL